MTHYYVSIIDGRHVVGVSTDGRDFTPLPRASFVNQRDALAFAAMREAAIRPQRFSDEASSVLPPASDVSSEQPNVGRSESAGG